jgi:hypothetical protein
MVPASLDRGHRSLGGNGDHGARFPNIFEIFADELRQIELAYLRPEQLSKKHG